MPTCGHPASNGPCQRTVPDEDTNCFMHSGNGPPKSHGAPAGNDNAVGNSGGGAPEGNINSYKHGGRADALKHYHRLGGPALEEAEEHVESLVESYALVHQVDEDEARADDDRMDDFRRLAAMHHKWITATAKVLEEDFVVEREREHKTDDGEIVTWTERVIHPAERATWRINGRERTLRKKHGISLRTVTEARDREQRRQQLAESFEQMAADADERDGR